MVFLFTILELLQLLELLNLSFVIVNFGSAGARQRLRENLDKVVHGGRGFGHFSPHQKHFKLFLRTV